LQFLSGITQNVFKIQFKYAGITETSAHIFFSSAQAAVYCKLKLRPFDRATFVMIDKQCLAEKRGLPC